jgi:L-alanine-DL-glutamate epimerase-like enolase superfamily enzyme
VVFFFFFIRECWWVGGPAARPPAALASVLESLEVRVESAVVERHAVMLPDYPGGPRPSSVVRVSGGGFSGLGENVAFLEQEQQRFAGHVDGWLRAHATASALEVGTALGAGGTAYERAALQAALIDLALRQAGLSLFDLTGVREASLRFVVSMAANSDLERAIQRLRLQGYRGDLKVDVDPSWDRRTLEMLARDSHIAIFDFKGRAEASLARRLYAAFPTALLEDPPPDFQEPELGSRASRISRDAKLVDEAAVAQARARGEAVNLKAPRMGGPLAVLRGLERALSYPPLPSESASEAGTTPRAYVGGMFEVDVGRIQARQLAALYCASAPNDLALNVTSERATPRTSSAPIRLDEPGFGTSSIE